MLMPPNLNTVTFTTIKDATTRHAFAYAHDDGLCLRGSGSGSGSFYAVGYWLRLLATLAIGYATRHGTSCLEGARAGPHGGPRYPLHGAQDHRPVSGDADFDTVGCYRVEPQGPKLRGSKPRAVAYPDL